VVALVSAVAAAAAPASAQAGESTPCPRVVNPYPDTRYEGSDLRRIRAVGVTCGRARRVARRAHRKALGMPVPPSGVRHFDWNGWHVTGDLRGDSDHYRAVRGAKRVRWVF
jgi:hypothetical protein